MRLRSNILLYLGPFVVLTLCLFFLFHYYLVRRTLMDNALAELASTEQNIHRAAEALLSTAINSYLRGITEKNLDYIESQFSLVTQGILSESQAKERIQTHFNLQPVGNSGYLVAVEEHGETLYLDIHPFLPHTDCTDTNGCQAWVKIRNGYTEYDWKNPEDNTYRKKAAYVREFKPWNWIVGASSYRDEFVDLVDVEDLSKLISPIRINQSGYFFLFDENDRILIHPEFKNVVGSELFNSKGENILELLKQSEDGYLTYLWKNPSEQREQLKYAFMDKLIGYNWYLVATGYLSEVYEPLEKLKKLTVAGVILTAGALFIIIYRLSKNISTPLLRLQQAVSNFYVNREPLTWKHHHIEEINVLGKGFDRMTSELDKSMSMLQHSNTELEAVQETIEENRLYLDSIINSMPSVIIGVDPHFRITQWNSRAQMVTGIAQEKAVGESLFDMYTDLQQYGAILQECLAENVAKTISHTSANSSDEQVYYEITFFPLLQSGSAGAVLRIDDVSERVDMEMRLQQSQKMDAIGQLAGGIAHDFNNMLSGIVGSAELLQQQVKPEQQKLTRIIMEASWRASELIQKLLAFARKESITFVPVNLHTIIIDTSEILKRTLHKRITIKTLLKADSAVVEGDWSQLQSSLLNIGINGGHAMVDGGTLTFSTNNIVVEGHHAGGKGDVLPAGRYLQIEIRDTGCGIPRKHLKQIFEPFFTTRSQDEGTGLGLAAVYGAIKQHNGNIAVESEVDRGTSFVITLPLSDAEQQEKTVQQRPIQGTGTILIIDDESIVRATAGTMLKKLGYATLEADNGLAGVQLYKKEQAQIDLVILDMLMPVMDGMECFYALKQINPDVRIIISSGFTRDADLHALQQDGLLDFIRKPYDLQELSRVIADALGNPHLN